MTREPNLVQLDSLKERTHTTQLVPPQKIVTQSCSQCTQDDAPTLNMIWAACEACQPKLLSTSLGTEGGTRI